jgi:tripartite-type tricarboxylate transporter receptor subunit TctC
MKRTVSSHNACIVAAAALVAGVPLSVAGQNWKPDRPVEFIVACAPGCGPDNAVRVMQRVSQSNRYFESPIAIQNKAGGGGTVARTYLRQFKGNGHYLYHGDRGLLAAQVMGRDEYTQVTPVAILFGDSVVFNWRAMFGAPGMTQPQVAYWENTFERLIETDDWKSHMALSNGITQFVRAAPMKKQMDEEYPEVRALLMELELAKK